MAKEKKMIYELIYYGNLDYELVHSMSYYDILEAHEALILINKEAES